MYLQKVVLVMGLVVLIHAQKICENCYKNGYFTCNGKNCQAFYVDSSISPSQHCGNAECSASTNSYYAAYKINNTVSLCIAFNYTTPHCNKFYKYNSSCSQCDQGYYKYYPLQTTSGGRPKCVLCSIAISGCERCDVQNQCKSCNEKYKNIKGICYTQDGQIVVGDRSFLAQLQWGDVVSTIITTITGFLLQALLNRAFAAPQTKWNTNQLEF